MLLGHLLHLNGIDSVIVESRSRDYVIDRVRYDIQAGWRPRATITERAAYQELLRRMLPSNVQLLVDGRCELAC